MLERFDVDRQLLDIWGIGRRLKSHFSNHNFAKISLLQSQFWCITFDKIAILMYHFCDLTFEIINQKWVKGYGAWTLFKNVQDIIA